MLTEEARFGHRYDSNFASSKYKNYLVNSSLLKTFKGFCSPEDLQK